MFWSIFFSYVSYNFPLLISTHSRRLILVFPINLIVTMFLLGQHFLTFVKFSHLLQSIYQTKSPIPFMSLVTCHANAIIKKLLFFLGWLIKRPRVRKKIVNEITLVTGCALAKYLSHDLICDSIHDLRVVSQFCCYLLKGLPSQVLCNLFPSSCRLTFSMFNILFSVAAVVIVTKILFM